MMSDELQALSLPGGDDGIRTHDPLLAGQVLSQLSYTPVKVVVSPNFCEAKISPAKQISTACGFHFCEAKISLQALWLAW